MTDRASVLTPTGVGDLFQIFRDGRPHTKSDVVGITGLSRATVSLRIEQLMTAGLLTAAGEGVSTGGRRPAQLHVNASAGVVLALDLGATHISVGVSDLTGGIIRYRTERARIDAGPIAVLDEALAVSHQLLVDVDAPVLGVGIGVPGAVEQPSGRPIRPPIMPGWDGFDVIDHVRRSFPVPVMVDNDVNVLALGDSIISRPQVQDLVFVKVATGLGAGIISGGRLQRGAQGSAGEIGHILVTDDETGEKVAIANVVSGPAIAARLRQHGLAPQTSADVIELIRRGDLAAIAATRNAGRRLGEVLATMVNVLNPSVIVLGGSMAYAGEHLLAGIREAVYSQSIPIATQDLSIVASEAGEQAGAAGAAAMIIQELLAPPNVEALVSEPIIRARSQGTSSGTPHRAPDGWAAGRVATGG